MNQNISDSTRKLLERRAQLLGPNVPTFYEEPVHVVRGEGVWLWDADGRKYLDCYNNVAHVGHCNARVVEAICRQASILNTHTRYLHETILEYVEKLTATFDASLSTAILTCTGSEANDIALRMATAATGHTGIIATDATYHGNTTAVAELSHNMGAIGSSSGRVRFVPAPDSYRPLGGKAGMAHAHAFADAVAEQIALLKKSQHGFAGIILCPFFANEGFPNLPQGWLKPTVDVVRAAGGIVICDEVQPGFGRLGSHMWGHQKQDIVPDVVTLGKPMANGHPVGAVVTSSDAISAFRRNFRYFNTFGGNPVSCAAALAVLEELEEKQLMEHGRRIGEYALERLHRLKERYDFIGDVRGSGQFFGAEMVLDRDSKTPATEFTDRVVNTMRQQGFILSKLGRYKNTLKIRPPMPFGKEHADLLFNRLESVLANTPLQQD